MLQLVCFVTSDSGKRTYVISKSYKDKNNEWKQNKIYITYAEYLALKHCEIFDTKVVNY